MGAPKHVLFVQNMFAIFGIFLPTLCVNCKFKMFHSNWCKVWAKMKSFNVFGLRLVLAELETTCAFKAMRWCAKRCSTFRMDPENAVWPFLHVSNDNCNDCHNCHVPSISKTLRARMNTPAPGRVPVWCVDQDAFLPIANQIRVRSWQAVALVLVFLGFLAFPKKQDKNLSLNNDVLHR